MKIIKMVKNKDKFNLLEQTKKHEANLLHKHFKLTMLYYNWRGFEIGVCSHGLRLLHIVSYFTNTSHT
jgi:hypothetical protein